MRWAQANRLGKEISVEPTGYVLIGSSLQIGGIREVHLAGRTLTTTRTGTGWWRVHTESPVRLRWFYQAIHSAVGCL